jgi:hypothetical protein
MATYYCPACDTMKSETPFCSKHGAMICKETVELEKLQNRKIAFVKLGLCEGLYINGRLVASAPQISTALLLESLGIDTEFVRPNSAWLDLQDHLPDSLEDVQI